MNYQDIKGLTEKELHLGLKEKRSELQKLKFTHAVAQIENPHKIRETRKIVARYMTEIGRRRNEKANAS